MAASLLKLVDDLYLVAGDIIFVQQVNILDMSIVKDKVVYMVGMDLSGFVDDSIVGLVQPVRNKALPLAF